MMTKENGPAPWWFGGLFLAAGGFIILIGMEVIPVDPSSVHAPMWVITMAGDVFFMGGVMAPTNGLIPEYASTVLAVIFISMLAAAFSWVAFGPGERQFSGGASVGPISTSSDGGGGSGVGVESCSASEPC